MIRPSYTLSLLGAALLLAGCGRERATTDPVAPRAVSTMTPAVAVAQTHVDLTGVVAAAESVDLVARVSGTLLAKDFQDGDPVQSGQLLFQLDPAAYAAQHAIDTARLAQAQSDDLRQRELDGDDATSQAGVDAARSTLAQAQGASRLSALNLSYTRIRAPFAGWVGASNADVGAYVTAGTRLGALQRIDEVKIEFSIGEQDILRLRTGGALTPGALVKVGLAGGADYPLTGRLDYVDKTLSATTGTLPIQAVVRNSATPQLLPGMFVRVRLETGADAPSMMLPQTVIQSDPLSDYVLLVGPDGKVARRDVATGEDVGSNRLIISGLSLIDRVIVSGLASVSVGDFVTVRPQTQTAAAAAKAAR